MKVYIAGPMTGIEEFNYPEFKATATALRATGLDVVCPTESDGDFDPTGLTGHEDLSSMGFDYRAKLLTCMTQIAACDAVAILEGWENSKGASAEVAFAQAIGLRLISIVAPTS